MANHPAHVDEGSEVGADGDGGDLSRLGRGSRRVPRPRAPFDSAVCHSAETRGLSVLMLVLSSEYVVPNRALKAVTTVSVPQQDILGNIL